MLIKSAEDRATFSRAFSYLSPMEKPGWHRRLDEAVAADGRKPRRISEAAGLGPNFISQIRKNGNAPKIDSAEKLCAELNISLVWLLIGLELDREGEELLRLVAAASPSERHHFLGLMRRYDKQL